MLNIVLKIIRIKTKKILIIKIKKNFVIFLFLSPYPPDSIIDLISQYCNKYIIYNGEISLDFIKENKIGFLISYGYKFIISSDIIEYLDNNIINLHISYLPYNRGAHPNLWSFIEGKPSGVTIHRIDKGIDTGKILLRKKVIINPKQHSFRSSYLLLKEKIEKLFIENWEDIYLNKINGFYPKSDGTFHLKKEGEKIFKKYIKNWDSNIYKTIQRIRNDS